MKYERGVSLTDHRLIAACSTRALQDAEASGGRTYRAEYEGGESRTFAVASAEHARVYAAEYGARIIGARVESVRWAR